MLFLNYLWPLEALSLPCVPPATADVPRPVRGTASGAGSTAIGTRRTRHQRRAESDASSSDEYVPRQEEREHSDLQSLEVGGSEEDSDAAANDHPEPAEAIFDLMAAIRDCDLAAVRRILRHTAGLVNYVLREARDAHFVCLSASSASADVCFVSCSQEGNITPLLHAVHFGRTRIAKKLLKKGADVHAADRNGWTALHFAVQNGFQKCVTHILRADDPVRSITAANGDGLTPLLQAAACGKHECLLLLLDKLGNDEGRAAAHLADAHGCNLLHHAVRGRHMECTRLVAERFPHLLHEKEKEQSCTPFMLAIANDNPAAARLLRGGGSNPDLLVTDACENGWSPLHMAMYHDSRWWGGAGYAHPTPGGWDTPK